MTPCPDTITRRDWFAMNAREEDIRAHGNLGDYREGRMRERARYRFADAMIRESNIPTETPNEK